MGPLALAGIGLASNLIGQAFQGFENRRLARYQADANERYLQMQLEYNSPKNQMARFQEAGLNPHLIYGQGNPGNQSQPLSYPEIKARDFGSLQNVVPLINQTKLANSQVSAQQAQMVRSYAQVEVAQAQAAVLKANPALDPDAFKAMVQMFVSNAIIKSTEAETAFNAGQVVNQLDPQTGRTRGQDKILKELEILSQRFDLNSQDKDIKAKILQSKEFQNAILEVEKKFMTDFELTPQNWMSFVQMLIMKFR